MAAWIVAGGLQPGYSHADQAISELGARNAAHPWVMNAGFVVLGLAIAALGVALLAVLPDRPASRVAAALFALAGVAMALNGVFQLDCGLTVDHACVARFDSGGLSWQTDAHLWAGLVFELAFVATPFAIARALWPGPAAALSLASGLWGVVFLAAAYVTADGTAAPDGLVQRIGFVPVHLWVLIVAAGVLHTLAAGRDRGELVPVRPRDFFGRAWAGRGEVVLEPAFVWRVLPQRLTFRRQSRWLNHDAWVVDDTTTFDNGFTLERRMFCMLDGPNRVRVAADDMPGGAELLLVEDGYRVRPYRLAIPVGPLRFTFTCHDRVREGPDGQLDWTIAFRWLGLPAARLSGRVRAVGDEPPA